MVRICENTVLIGSDGVAPQVSCPPRPRNAWAGISAVMQAFSMMWHLEKALQSQVDALASGKELTTVSHPVAADTAQVLAVLPHGTGTVKVVEGGLEVANEAGTDKTVIAQAAAIVRLDL